MTIRHNDLLVPSAYVVLLLVRTRINIKCVRLHNSTLVLRWFLGFSSWIQMKLSEQRESFCKWREKKSAKYSTTKERKLIFWAATSTTIEGVREILITSIKLILFSVKTVWSGFILIIAQDFRADLLYRGNVSSKPPCIQIDWKQYTWAVRLPGVQLLARIARAGRLREWLQHCCKENFHWMWAASENKPIYNLFIWLFLHTNLLLIYLFAGPLLCTCIFQWCKDSLPKLGRSTTFPV